MLQCKPAASWFETQPALTALSDNPYIDKLDFGLRQPFN